MKRLPFQLLVTIATFVLGTMATVAWSFFNPLHREIAVIPPHSDHSIPDLFIPTEMPAAGDETIRQTSQVAKKLTRQLVDDINANGNNFRLSAEDMKILRGNLKSKLIDLNGDSVPEFFLYIDHYDWCGAGYSNCAYWVYRKTKGGYKLLLEETMLKPADTFTDGYRDLISEYRMGFGEYSVTVYRWDGDKYQPLPSRDVRKER